MSLNPEKMTEEEVLTQHNLLQQVVHHIDGVPPAKPPILKPAASGYEMAVEKVFKIWNGQTAGAGLV